MQLLLVHFCFVEENDISGVRNLYSAFHSIAVTNEPWIKFCIGLDQEYTCKFCKK
jgi:hypothetical protein